MEKYLKKSLDYVKKNKRMMLSVGLLFVIALVYNFLTPYTADDYSYMYSFADGRRITNVFQIFSSMKAHYQVANGRTVAHFLVQLMFLSGRTVFNMVNALVFTGISYLIYKITNTKKQFSMLVFFAIPICFWIWVPAYGQVFLWKTGSVNYSWSYFFGLIYLGIYAKLYIDEINLSAKQMVWLCILGLFFGAYTENMSFAIIATSFLILLLRMRETHAVRSNLKYVLPMCFGAAGYLTILLSPAVKKYADFENNNIIHNMIQIFIDFYTQYRQLILIWTALLVMAVYFKTDRKRIRLAAMYLLIGVIAQAMLSVAGYMAERSKAGSVVFLVISIVQLMQCMRTVPQWEVSAYVLSAYFLMASPMLLWNGSYDIYNTCRESTQREAYIEEQVAAGEKTVTVPIIYAATQYSCKYDLVDLQTDDTDSWPNAHVAKYYGLDKIYGAER